MIKNSIALSIWELNKTTPIYIKIAKDNVCLWPNLSEYLPKTKVAGNPTNWVSSKAGLKIQTALNLNITFQKELEISEPL